MNKRKIMPVFLLMAMMMFSFAPVSAATCTGQDCPATTSVTVGNAVPVVSAVAVTGGAITLNGGTTTDVTVTFNASDGNGYADLDHATASVSLSKGGESTRTSASCDATENSTLVSVFSCVVTMQFYDTDGADWVVNASVSDDSAAYDEDTAVSATVNVLDFVTNSGEAVTWAAATAGTANQEAGNTITVTNGGNQDYSAFTVKGYNATNGANEITAASFGVGNVTGLAGTQVMMVHDTPVSVTSLLTGLTTHGAAVTEEVFFYVDVAGGTPALAYTQSSNWAMLFAA